MLFNSFEFLIFFPVVTLLYFLLPHRFRWMHLLLASCLFYCFFIPVYILILFVTILIDYYAALYIDRSKGKAKKRWLWFSILSTCFILFLFKYFNFFNENFSAIARFFHLNYPVEALSIILPIGLSFHTFQSLSYVIEVYKGNQKPEKHFGIYSLYVMFYPQLVAGPIERPQNVLHQFYEKHRFDYDDVIYGLKKIVWGLFKKVVVADRLSIYVNAVYNNSEQHNGSSLLLATVFFAFQIYCDFSGYSDIAIGSARVMGFRLMKNFNRPYFALTISEFWKRWHISLSTWFRDYIYIPLGGNRVSSYKKSFNLFLTFLISGFWHGANWTYIIWGGLNGVYLIVGQLFSTQKGIVSSPVSFFEKETIVRPLKIASTFTLICISWIFFRAKDLNESLLIIQKILFSRGALFIGDLKNLFYGFLFLSILLVVEFFEEYKLFSAFSLIEHNNVIIRRFAFVLVVIMILMFGVFDSSQFIYFQF